MKWLKILAFILGSAWFFPVSCTSALYAGIHIKAHLDEREVNRGDQLHNGFSVAVLSKHDATQFQLLAFSELHRFRVVGEQYQLLLPKPFARMKINDYQYIAYRVLEQKENSQLIEVEDSNDDRTIWSCYRTDGRAVTPIASRMFHVGYMMNALPYAFGVALFLHGIGLILRRRIAHLSST
ncbi:hypothetical protein [Chromatium okenii]|uniref:hypothetical protein n=1 Tax=Chromatium okenii TaxID=61644 RepID=UPI0026EA7E61|nr:hypothetical protein [Chromatium okenii]MBV5310244.1 hypothetical protein [Chromatium okenii]